MRLPRRARVGVCIAVWLVSAIVPASGQPPHAGVSLPLDFQPRFISACQRRGLPPERCQCMTGIILREVADEHLALMLDYLENPDGFDSRAMQELDNDEARMRMLEEEIQAAQTAARAACTGR